MLMQTCTAALATLAALGSLSFAIAEEPKAANGERQIANSIGMKLTLVPSGEFMMGSGESAEETAAFCKKNYGTYDVSADRYMDEHPQHRVRITKPFYLGTYHVTRRQYRQFVKDSGYKTDAARGDDAWQKAGFEQTDEHPVVNVSWNDAVAFCKWLSRKEGKTYRLPTEAEWEYACRAGTTTRYCSGDDPETLAKVGNVADAAFTKELRRAGFTGVTLAIKANDGYAFTAPVGQFKPNAFGLYDMHGNAWQWCADWHREDYYGKSPIDDPKGPDSGDGHVLRGGSWDSGPSLTRTAARVRITPDDNRLDFAGFRVVRTLQ